MLFRLFYFYVLCFVFCVLQLCSALYVLKSALRFFRIPDFSLYCLFNRVSFPVFADRFCRPLLQSAFAVCFHSENSGTGSSVYMCFNIQSSVSRFRFPFPVSCFLFPVSRFLFPVSRLPFPFPVSCFASPVSRFPSSVFRFPSPVSVSRFPSPVSRFLFPVSRFPFPVFCFPFSVSCFPSPAPEYFYCFTNKFL